MAVKELAVVVEDRIPEVFQFLWISGLAAAYSNSS